VDFFVIDVTLLLSNYLKRNFQ